MPRSASKDYRALAAVRAYQSLHVPGNVLERAPGFFLEQLAFVVVDGDVVGKAQELAYFLAREHGQALPRIEKKRQADGAAFARMGQHPFFAVGPDDRELRAEASLNAVVLRSVHRSRMECGDL